LTAVFGTDYVNDGTTGIGLYYASIAGLSVLWIWYHTAINGDISTAEAATE
jgi:hypothetical protein